MYLGIGKQIRNYRKEKNLTMDQLAKEVGVTAQAISQYERDLRLPSNEILKRISKALNIDNVELLFPSDMFTNIEYVFEILIRFINNSLKDDSNFTINDINGFTSKEVFELSTYLNDYAKNIIENRKNNITSKDDIIFKITAVPDSTDKNSENNMSSNLVNFKIL